jgi:hypothetical protein
VVLFPEGTSHKGDRIYPLKTALLEWAAQKRYPVHAVSLSYGTPNPGFSPSDDICWWGDAPFAAHFLNLLTIPRVTATLTFSPEPVVEDNRSRLGSRLHELLARGFTPVEREDVTDRAARPAPGA